MNSLHHLYNDPRNLPVLTIKLPKLLATFDGQRGGTNRSVRQLNPGRIVNDHVGHFLGPSPSANPAG